MSNEIQQITPFDGYGGDMGEFAPPGAGPTALARPTGGGYGGMGPMGGEPAPAAAPQGGIARKIHNSLRGRYLIAVALGLVCGFTGAYFGWRSQKPIYRAEAVIQIRQNLKLLNIPFSDGGGFIPNFEELLQSETMMTTSQRIIRQAMQSKEWKNTGLPDTPDAIPTIAANLSAEHPSRTEFIRVYYTDRDPGVAASVVSAVTKAYEEFARGRSNQDEVKRLNVLSDQRVKQQSEVNRLDAGILKIANQFGTASLDSLFEARLQEVNKIESRLNEAELALQAAERKLDTRQTVQEMSELQIAMIDPVMRQYVMEREQIETEIMRLEKTGVMKENVKMKQLGALLESQTKKVERYAVQWRAMQIKIAEDPNLAQAGGLPRLVAMSPAVIKAEYDSLKVKHTAMKKDLLEIGQASLQIQELQKKRDDAAKEAAELGRRIEAILMDAQLGQRLFILSYGEVPAAPYKDRRKMFGAAGGLGGFGFPVALLVLFGLMDRRYRYSDEADNGVSNVPLLGILPRLPDRLTDPEQAAVAAHCIHQIRIMLQVGENPESRRVFMITSASTGDGKTSLTMALGLSFAASGSKTLVIDCDMVGQGLTHRLKADNVPGLIETLNLGTLRGHVRKTATKGLYVLPIGNADAVHAGALSPQSIARLLTACREHFDIIVIDTGPILGSLEASVVAAEADGVILAVARGQQQPLVEKAIKHLRSIGAHMFGIVFNRAEHRDFQRSVPSASIRSLSAKPMEQRPLLPEADESSRFGPLARSVASSMPAGHPGAPALPGPNGNPHGTGNGHTAPNPPNGHAGGHGNNSQKYGVVP